MGNYFRDSSLGVLYKENTQHVPLAAGPFLFFSKHKASFMFASKQNSPAIAGRAVYFLCSEIGN
jgi:hypothetical protein